MPGLIPMQRLFRWFLMLRNVVKSKKGKHFFKWHIENTKTLQCVTEESVGSRFSQICCCILPYKYTLMCKCLMAEALRACHWFHTTLQLQIFFLELKIFDNITSRMRSNLFCSHLNGQRICVRKLISPIFFPRTDECPIYSVFPTLDAGIKKINGEAYRVFSALLLSSRIYNCQSHNSKWQKNSSGRLSDCRSKLNLNNNSKHKN